MKLARFKDITGKKFGMLVAAWPAGMKRHEAVWLCFCECGGSNNVMASRLATGNTASCGCFRKRLASERNRRHGHCSGRISTEYNSWSSMIRRCSDPKNNRYQYYGGRGIRVCERWLDFKNFLADMGMKPQPRLTIDRINPNGNYEPPNCKWSTYNEQRHNRRDSLR
jgi:hypothetical protein